MFIGEDFKKLMKFYLPLSLIFTLLLIFLIAAITMGATSAPQYKMYDQKWEKFDQQLYRYSIYDGWLVKYGSMGMTFVPDAAHQWKLEEDKNK